MNDTLINLLPPDRKHELTRAYYLRLGVMAAFLVATLTVIAGIFLIPTYVYLSKNTTAKKEQLSAIEAVLSSSNEAALSVRLSTLSLQAGQIAALGKVRSASVTLRTFLDIPRPGIFLTGFKYARAAGKTPSTLMVSGIATTRESLRSYQTALQGSPLATAADLPVSAYAKDSNITFTINVTLAP